MEVGAFGSARSPRDHRPRPAPSRCRRAGAAAGAHWRSCQHCRWRRQRIVVGGVDLGGEHDLLVGPHHLFKRCDRFFTAHKQRHDHVGKDHNVAQRQHRMHSSVLRRDRPRNSLGFVQSWSSLWHSGKSTGMSGRISKPKSGADRTGRRGRSRRLVQRPLNTVALASLSGNMHRQGGTQRYETVLASKKQ
jgi:hypothetical protein